MKISRQKIAYYENYIKRNYGEIPTRVISEELGISKYHVCRIAERLGLKISREQLSELCYYTSGNENPNPITETTRMLICKYYYNGDSISKISYFLMRPCGIIRKILDESMKNGYYYKINNVREVVNDKRKTN